MSHSDYRLLKPAVVTTSSPLSQQRYNSDSQRWYAVQSRDVNANNAFYYGAITTSIYCRPTCPGRVARRSNIVFFGDTSTAVQCGYRPCKRCRPDLDLWDRNARGRELVRDAQRLIHERCVKQEIWAVEDVAKQLGISAAHLHRLFKKHLGRTPKSFPYQQSSTTIEIDHALPSTEVLSADNDTDCLPDLLDCTKFVDALEQRWDAGLPDDIGLDLDFSCDNLFSELSAVNTFDLDMNSPIVGGLDLPSIDEGWTERLSI